MNLMRYKLLFFIFSILVMLPGLYYLFTSGLKLGIDFTGGTLLEYKFEQEVSKEQLSEFGVVTKSGDRTFIIRTKPLEVGSTESGTLVNFKNDLKNKHGEFEVKREETVGPVIGNELKKNALIALLVMCIAIVGYISWAFRKVPKPTSSVRFGISAIVALIHDVIIVVGAFAIFGHFYQVEVDTLFVTAVLTIIGFSVHDTIVVFDRIRENLPKHLGTKFSDIADISITQTLARSLNTSLTVVFVLLALLLFGGESIRWFVVALLIGIISGTYSSIFNATALLSYWEEKLGH